MHIYTQSNAVITKVHWHGNTSVISDVYYKHLYLLPYRYQWVTVYIYFIMSGNLLSVFNLLRFNCVYLLSPEETVKRACISICINRLPLFLYLFFFLLCTIASYGFGWPEWYTKFRMLFFFFFFFSVFEPVSAHITGTVAAETDCAGGRQWGILSWVIWDMMKPQQSQTIACADGDIISDLQKQALCLKPIHLTAFQAHLDSTAVVQMWCIVVPHVCCCGTKCCTLWYQMYHICTTLAVKVDAFVTMIDSWVSFHSDNGAA